MVKGKPVRIPHNSIYFIINCDNQEKMIDLLSNSEFQKAQAEMSNVAMSFGASIKMSTNPKLS